MTLDLYCYCGSSDHEKVEECHTRQCPCCLTDHHGACGKNIFNNKIFRIKKKLKRGFYPTFAILMPFSQQDPMKGS